MPATGLGKVVTIAQHAHREEVDAARNATIAAQEQAELAGPRPTTLTETDLFSAWELLSPAGAANGAAYPGVACLGRPSASRNCLPRSLSGISVPPSHWSPALHPPAEATVPEFGA
jgi:hypothetical protein